MYISLSFIHVLVFLCEIVYFHVYVCGDVVYGILDVLICDVGPIHVCGYSTVHIILVLIA